MKKKVLYGVALALFASVGMGTLQSCKDDVSDLEQVVTYDRNNLQKQIDGLSQEVENCRTNCKNRMDDLQNQINNKADKTAVQELWDELTKYVTLTELQNQLNTLKTNLETYTDNKITDLINNTINPLATRVGTLETKVSTLETTVSQHDQMISDLAAELIIQKKALEELQTTVNSQSEEIQKLVDGQVALQKAVGDILNDIDDINDAIEELKEYTEEELTKLKNLLNSMITGIIVQGTDSPVFGNFSLPLGIKSNLLFNWYGYNAGEAFNFPTKSTEHAYYQDNEGLSDAVMAIAPTYPIEAGYFGNAEDGVVLGKLYMTINPAGNMFDDASFKLETSAENQFPAQLAVTKSDDELFFGYTRTAGLVEGNGFYEAEVKVLKNDIKDAAITIDAGLKSSVKEVLKTPNRSTAYSLLKAVYNQFNGMLPAYAVRYDWTAEEYNDRSVLSGYDLAAATAHPLSYSFLYGESYGEKMRTFGSLQNLIEKIKDSGKLSFDLGEPIQFDDITLDLGEINFGINAGNIEVSLPNATVNVMGTPESVEFTDKDGNPVTILAADMTDFYEKLNTQITTAFKEQVSPKLNSAINEQLLQVINEKLAEMYSTLDQKINGTITGLLDDIEGSSYFKRLDDLVSLYNKVANKVNNFLANPNHYLQPAIFYNMGDGNIGILSNNPNDATTFEGDGYINLYASSYSAEIVAPAFKKYVVVSKDLDDASADLATLNAGGRNLNSVFDGIRVGISSANLESGHVYEISYQAVDYSGVTSTQKFYIKVK